MTRPAALAGSLLAVAALVHSVHAQPVVPASGLPPARLTLADAVARARSQHVDARTAAEAEGLAAERVVQARAGYWPRVDVTEIWQRGTHPVFAFSTLLAQRRFTESDFAIDRLNHPDPIGNFRSALLVEQLVFDGGAVRAAVRSATLGRDDAALARRQVEQEVAVAATEAFGQVLAMQARRRAAAAAVAAAEQDAARTRARHAAGLATEADALALDVHLARMREEEIRAAGDERVSRAQLNRAIGAPLEAAFDLDSTPPAPDALAVPADLEREALAARPEVKRAEVQEELSKSSLAAARAGFLPQVGLQGGWEWNGGTFSDRASSWVAGAQVRLNLFNGLADRARVAEARHAVARSALARERAETDVRLDVLASLARLESARARDAVGRAAAAQAREAQRITRDRYEAGLVDVASLLRAAQAVQQADFQEMASRVDVLVAVAALDRAVGR